MRIAFGTAVAILRKKYIEKYIGTYHMVKHEDLSEDYTPKVFPKKTKDIIRFHKMILKKYQGNQLLIGQILT